MLEILAIYAACAAVAAGMLHPIREASPWRYAFAVLGPLAVLFILGDALALTLDRLTGGKEDASA